ncbi:MAG: hypothetical protein ACREXJ_14340, partial [Gammaproteobacteria bacterium]
MFFRLTVVLTDIHLVELVAGALELFQAIAEDQQITITADLPDHCRIHGDRQRLQRVVANPTSATRLRFSKDQ